MMFPPRRLAALCALIVLYSFVSECKGDGYPPAPNCAKFECPQYSVVHSEKDYEIRSYKNALWVSGPSIQSNSYKDAADRGFITLFNYILGSKSQNVKINMTTPVLVDVQNSTYTVYFYVPQKYQTGGLPPPFKGQEKQIQQVKLPKHKYAAVRRFDGFIKDDNIPTQIGALRKSLQRTPYQRAAAIDLFTLAGYNSPFEPINRVNEVFLWFD